MESAVEEIGNIVASKISIDNELCKLIGSSRVSPPIICDLLETHTSSIPMKWEKRAKYVLAIT